MMNGKNTNTIKLQKATGLVAPVVHARAKASAAMKGQKFQEWIAEAMQEKLEREDRAKGRTA
jgi:predicted HicB family RNase H-like nuclease